MDAKELRELIEIISRSNFTTFELEREGFRLKLVKGGASAALAASSAELSVPASAAAVAPVSAAPPSPSPEPKPDGLVDQTSPIVGTFYRATSPGAAPFVEVGSRVKRGQVLCIIEAMKLMNEIEAEIDAEIVEILVANGQPVEFGEVMFRLRPLA